MCSKFNLIATLLILTNFAAFLHYTKENAGVSKNDSFSLVNFYIHRKYMPEATSTPNLVVLFITSQELGGGGFAPTKIGLSNSPTIIGLKAGSWKQKRETASGSERRVSTIESIMN